MIVKSSGGIQKNHLGLQMTMLATKYINKKIKLGSSIPQKVLGMRVQLSVNLGDLNHRS